MFLNIPHDAQLLEELIFHLTVLAFGWTLAYLNGDTH